MNNKFISIIFQLLYAAINYKISINYHSDDPLKYIFGILIGVTLISISEDIIFRMAYSLVGSIFGGKGIGDPDQKSAAHWLFRIIFIGILYLINRFGWLNLLIDYLAGFAVNKYNEFINDLTQKLLHILTPNY